MNPTLRNWLIILVVGAAIWFSRRDSNGAWHIFAVFVATVLGFILHPMPIGAIAFISLTFCCFTRLKTSRSDGLFRHHLTHRLRVLPLARLHQNRIRPPHCLCDHQADWAFFAHARLLHCTL